MLEIASNNFSIVVPILILSISVTSSSSCLLLLILVSSSLFLDKYSHPFKVSVTEIMTPKTATFIIFAFGFICSLKYLFVFSLIYKMFGLKL